MSGLLVIAQVVVRPCEGIDEGSWWWWIKGCWLLQSETWLLVGIRR